jgi:hypothetical protein
MRWLALLVVAACGDNIKPVDLGPYSQGNLDARCALEVRCGLFATVADCEAVAHITDDSSTAHAIEAGTESYDPAQAQRCFDAIAAASCDATAMDERTIPAACSGIFTGHGGMGDACAFDAECASANCVVPDCSAACCTGTCGAAVSPGAIGAHCTKTGCVDGAFCDDSRTCEPLAAAGEHCLDGTGCDFGLGCVGTTATSLGTCAVLPAIGEPCPDGQCADIGATCNAAMMCVALGLPPAACTADVDCSYNYRCDDTGHCAALPVLGEACTNRCSDGSWCDMPPGATTGTCTAPQLNGSPCSFDTSCASLYCEHETAPFTCADLPLCF